MTRPPARYAIIDEPGGSPLQRLAMAPLLPFIAYMLFMPVGAALFVVNALALRARTMFWEISFAVLGAALWARTLLVEPGLNVLLGAGVISAADLNTWGFGIKYAMLIPLAISLWCGYKIFLWQSASHEVLTYFDRANARQGDTPGDRR